MNAIAEPITLERIDLEERPAQPLTVQQSQPLAAVPTTGSQNPLMRLLETAVANKAPIEQIRALVELEREIRQDMAKQAFNDAMAEFKKDPPEVFKDKHVYFVNKTGQETSYDHAQLATENNIIIRALARHGIHHRWDTEQTEGQVKIICVLTKGAYEQRTPLQAGHDSSGGKNTIQALGSAVRYLERYTLEAATGIVPGDLPDDDGRGAGPGTEPDADPVLTGFTAAALKGEKALRAHYEANVPTEEFWTSKGAYLRKIAKGVDQQAAQVAA